MQSINSVKFATLRIQGQEERRQRILKRQREYRDQVVAKLRSGEPNYRTDHQTNAADGVERSLGDDDRLLKGARKQKKARSAALYYSSLLQTPEWMLDVPLDLGAGSWLVMPRPEGQRCLVYSQNSETIVRKKNGHIWFSFKSSLPNGGEHSHRPQDGQCVLECIYYEPVKTLFIIDLLCWKGQWYENSDAEFRFAWLRSLLNDLVPTQSVEHVAAEVSFGMIPRFVCDHNGLREAYFTKFAFEKDGLLLYSRFGHYMSGNLTPLALCWKDRNISRYALDTPDGINPYKVQTCVLKVDEKCNLRALGGDIVCLGSPVICDDAQTMTTLLRPGVVARFAVLGKVFANHQDALKEDSFGHGSSWLQITPAPPNLFSQNEAASHIQIEKLRFEKICPATRAPDSSCKIAFQYALRHDDLKFDTLTSKLMTSATCNTQH